MEIFKCLSSEEDNRGVFTLSGCKMYNISAFENVSIDQWHFTKNDTISERKCPLS